MLDGVGLSGEPDPPATGGLGRGGHRIDGHIGGQVHRTIQGRLDIAKYITLPKGELAGRLLLVDDLADSGVTLQAVVERLRGMPAISELRSAVIWVKGVSTYTPDYFVERLPTSPWIHQPFEEYDSMRPDRLAQKFVV